MDQYSPTFSNSCTFSSSDDWLCEDSEPSRQSLGASSSPCFFRLLRFLGFCTACRTGQPSSLEQLPLQVQTIQLEYPRVHYYTCTYYLRTCACGQSKVHHTYVNAMKEHVHIGIHVVHTEVITSTLHVMCKIATEIQYRYMDKGLGKFVS